MKNSSIVSRSLVLVVSSCLAACGARTTLMLGDESFDGGANDANDVSVDTSRDVAPDVSIVDIVASADVVDVVEPIDVIVVDAPAVDVPAIDVVAMDAPASDVPVVDVPVVDVPIAPACPFPLAGALTVPSAVAGTLAGANNIPSTSCVAAAGGPEAIYSLHLDATTGISLLTGGMLDTILSIRTACDAASSEIACDDDHGPGVRSSIRRVLPAGDYFVVVDRFGAAGATGPFTLETSEFTPVANSNCTTPLALVPGTAARGDTHSATDVPRSCLATNEGPELFYSLTIPPGQRAVVNARPDAPWRTVLRVRDNCSSAACVVSSTSGSDGAATSVTVDNHDPSASRSVIISVGSTGADVNGTFTLDANVSPYPMSANATCSMATMIGDGTMLRGEDLSAATDSLAAACLPAAMGRVLYYTATIPAASTLTVRVVPSGFDAVVRALDACGATSCLASSNAGFTGATETLRFDNSGPAARTMIVAVGSTTAASGLFDLSASIARDPYASETIAANCDDMTAAPIVAGVATDDSSSPVTPLPFAFRYFAAPVTNYSITSNGFVQLWSTTGAPSNAFANVAIPASSTPNGFAAAFWDDLFPASGGGTDVRTRYVMAAPPHFTVQWTNWSISPTSPSRLTFQAKFFEGTDIVEFHYCNLVPETTGTRARGSSATIGLEDATGATGTQFSFNSASVDTGVGVRFTPAP